MGEAPDVEGVPILVGELEHGCYKLKGPAEEDEVTRGYWRRRRPRIGELDEVRKMSLRLGAAAAFSSSSAHVFLIPIFAPNLISVLQQWFGCLHQ